jgi:membrane protease YdiL (CAAX protease family)
LDVAVAALIGRRAPWVSTAFAAALGVIPALVLLGLLLLAVGVPSDDDVLTAYSLLGEVLYGVFAFGIAYRVAKRYGGYRRAFGLDRPRLADAWTVVRWSLLQFGVRILAAIVLFAVLPGLRDRSVGNLNGVGDLGPIGVALLAIAAVVVAPVVEEFAMRGVLLRALLRRLPFAVSAAISSFVFGALHALSADSWASLVFLVPTMTVFGVFQCLLVRRTARLGPAIGVHATTNLVAVAIAVASAHG